MVHPAAGTQAQPPQSPGQVPPYLFPLLAFVFVHLASAPLPCPHCLRPQLLSQGSCMQGAASARARTGLHLSYPSKGCRCWAQVACCEPCGLSPTAVSACMWLCVMVWLCTSSAQGSCSCLERPHVPCLAMQLDARLHRLVNSHQKASSFTETLRGGVLGLKR